MRSCIALNSGKVLKQMKLNNNLIVFDLETTADNRQDITEIGAVALDRELNIISGYSSLINIGRPVDEKSQLITGITDGMLQDAPSKEQALEGFVNWVASTGNIKQARLSAWGNYFDINILRRDLNPFPFSGTAIDVKSLAFLWASLSNNRTDRLSVEYVSESLMGLPSPGAEGEAYHRALVDAKQTALILKRIFNDLGGGVFLQDGTYVQVSVTDK